VLIFDDDKIIFNFCNGLLFVDHALFIGYKVNAVLQMLFLPVSHVLLSVWLCFMQVSLKAIIPAIGGKLYADHFPMLGKACHIFSSL